MAACQFLRSSRGARFAVVLGRGGEGGRKWGFSERSDEERIDGERGCCDGGSERGRVICCDETRREGAGRGGEGGGVNEG